MRSPSDILLELRDIHVHYGGIKALDGASISLDEGEVVALMGPNGAGKSTLVKAIFGLAPLSSGSVYWNGQKIRPVPHEVVERGIAYVPQGRRVFRHLTVEENLEIGGFSIRDKTILRERMKLVMETFPVLKERRKIRSGTLSGGQQQMLAIARGLMQEPKVLLLDEPSLGLAPKVVKEMFASIAEINRRHKTAIVVVEHNVHSLLHIATRTYVLLKGKIYAEGEPADILRSGVLEKAFLG